MRAWYLADPEQECSVAILEGELGFTVRQESKGGDAVVEDLAFVEEVEVSEEHLGAAFADTVQVSSATVVGGEGLGMLDVWESRPLGWIGYLKPRPPFSTHATPQLINSKPGAGTRAPLGGGGGAAGLGGHGRARADRRARQRGRLGPRQLGQGGGHPPPQRRVAVRVAGLGCGDDLNGCCVQSRGH